MLRSRLAVALLLSAGAVPIGAAPAAAAPHTSGTICVALVVDAHSIGGPVDSGCVTVKKGATGLDVLQAGGHSVTFREDHLLCTIDGLPKSGCSAVDDSHYWAYYHRAPGQSSWSYSSSGAGSYQPANASTEGWVYEDGTQLRPDNVPYSSICKTTPTPTPSPTPAHTTHPARTHRPVAGASTPKPLTSAVLSTGSPHQARRHHAPHGRSPTPEPTGSAVAGGTTPSASPAASTSGASSSGSGHGTAIGVVIAAVIVGGLGAAALTSGRRRRRD